jgi:hypothetical protein
MCLFVAPVSHLQDRPHAVSTGLGFRVISRPKQHFSAYAGCLLQLFCSNEGKWLFGWGPSRCSEAEDSTAGDQPDAVPPASGPHHLHGGGVAFGTCPESLGLLWVSSALRWDTPLVRSRLCASRRSRGRAPQTCHALASACLCVCLSICPSTCLSVRLRFLDPPFLGVYLSAPFHAPALPCLWWRSSLGGMAARCADSARLVSRLQL